MKNQKEIIENYFVGDTVILKKETNLTQKQNIKLGAIGIVSDEDNKETLEGWEKVNLEEEFKKEIDNMSPDKIEKLFNDLVQIGKIKNSDKIEDIIKKSE